MSTKPKIYLSNGPASRSVGLTVEALKLDVEYITVDASAGENKTPQYVSMNPQATVPTLNDNGKIVWDSHAIIRYLATVYGETDTLCPKEPFLRAKLDQRIHFEDGVLFQKFATVVRPIFHGNETEFDPDAVKASSRRFVFCGKLFNCRRFVSFSHFLDIPNLVPGIFTVTIL